MTDENLIPENPIPENQWSPASYERNARFVSDMGAGVLALLGPRPGERILDIGCGDGALTMHIKQAGATVVGIDQSPEFVAACIEKGLDARLGNAEELSFSAGFDAVFSNAALHWMRKPEAVIKGVRKSLKIGGRFVGEMGGHGNVAAICSVLMALMNARGLNGAARFPYFFPTAQHYTQMLQEQGFKVKQADIIYRPTPLPTGMEGWLETFAGPFFAGMDEADKKTIIKQAVAALAPSLHAPDGTWTADYVRLRFYAVAQ